MQSSDHPDLDEYGTVMTIAICVIMAAKAAGDMMAGCADSGAGWPAILVLILFNINTIYILSMQAKESKREKLWKRTKAFMHTVGKAEHPSREGTPEETKDI